MAKPPPECKYCKKTLKWPPWTGKPSRPTNSDGSDHSCKGGGKSNYKTRWTPPLKAVMCRFCDMCGKWFVTEKAQQENPELHYITIDYHVKIFHPNGEILDNIDDMVLTDKEKEETRILWNQPKRVTKYMLEGKRVY